MSDHNIIQSTPLTGLHLLLSYECNYECDHCFVWGGPSQGGTMSMRTIERILEQAEDLGTIEWIYFEGGEPFLFYDLLCTGVQLANQRGFRVGIVSNAFWATTQEKALEYLQPLAGMVEDLSISDDNYHGSGDGPRETLLARQTAEQLGIPVDFIHIKKTDVVHRGRAAAKLAPTLETKPWEQFTECPGEELRYPDRVHVDAYGNLHICQGISIGNLLERPLFEIMRDYTPEDHPIVGPLLTGGPTELARHFELSHKPAYADACHLCYDSRCKLKDKLPDVLKPDQMYGKSGCGSSG